MAKKPPPNWEEIKTRYTVKGEKPADIAADYNVTPRTITKRAFEEKWGDIRAQIGQEIREETKNKLTELVRLNLEVHAEFLKKLKSPEMMELITNPFLFDGERVNSLFQTAMNNATRLAQSQLKLQDDIEQPEETPGFSVSSDD